MSSELNYSLLNFNRKGHKDIFAKDTKKLQPNKKELCCALIHCEAIKFVELVDRKRWQSKNNLSNLINLLTKNRKLILQIQLIFSDFISANLV